MITDIKYISRTIRDANTRNIAISESTNGFTDNSACLKIQSAVEVIGADFSKVPTQCKRKVKRRYKGYLLLLLSIPSDMDFSETNVYSTLHVCWGAQAGLYYHYGVHKQLLPEKMFGVFEHRVTRPSNPLVRGFDEVFYAPHSRHTGISREDVDNCKALRILAESDAAGPFLMSTENGRQIFVTGHPEYDKYTLDSEYRRDVDKGLPIHVPVNYYPDDDPTKPPLFRWRAHAHLLYENWLNYYVYQNTPYDLGEIQRVKHE